MPWGQVSQVAPLAGSVDRNNVTNDEAEALLVAPLAGSVDRNTAFALPASGLGDVAPLAGSVDRNHFPALPVIEVTGSLPSRGAWIEIIVYDGEELLGGVAPLAGSVDRNT